MEEAGGAATAVTRGGGDGARRRGAGAGRGGRTWDPGPRRRLAVERHVAAPGWGDGDVRRGADNVRPREVENFRVRGERIRELEWGCIYRHRRS